MSWHFRIWRIRLWCRFTEWQQGCGSGCHHAEYGLRRDGT